MRLLHGRCLKFQLHRSHVNDCGWRLRKIKSAATQNTKIEQPSLLLYLSDTCSALVATHAAPGHGSVNVGSANAWEDLFFLCSRGSIVLEVNKYYTNVRQHNLFILQYGYMFRLDVSHLQAPTITLPDALSTLGSQSVYMWITYLLELLEITGLLLFCRLRSQSGQSIW